MDEGRRVAWEAAIEKLRRREEVSPEEHCDLLREGMFEGVATPDVFEEADLFLDYWLHHLSIDPLPWFGEIIARSWFRLREWDGEWGSKRAETALRDYVAADDFDHWAALNLIATRLHREHELFPDTLADWAANIHRSLSDGTLKPPKKEQGHEGQPPYTNEDRNGVFFMADDWLKHYGMTRANDRIDVIARYTGDDESVVSKGLTRARNNGWRRAPWPKQ